MTSNLLTHSRMQCFRSCPRKHFYRYELGLSTVKESRALRFGSRFHAALDQLANGVERDDVLTWLRHQYSELPEWCQTEDDLTEMQVEEETIVNLVAAYYWRWGEQDANLTILRSEIPFECDLVNPDTGAKSNVWRLAGKTDKLIRYGDDRILIRETKTTGEAIDAEADYWRRLRIDPQISIYVLGLRSLGIDVRGIEYDVVRKPAIAPKLTGKGAEKRRETPEEFGERLLRDCQERPEFYFHRREIARTINDLDLTARELWQTQKMIRACQREQLWPRNVQACTFFGACEFIPICWTDTDVSSSTPDGFVRLDDVHPELRGATDEHSSADATKEIAATPAAI